MPGFEREQRKIVQEKGRENVRRIACPYCGVPAGKVCRGRDNDDRIRNHAERWERYKQLRELERSLTGR